MKIEEDEMANARNQVYNIRARNRKKQPQFSEECAVCGIFEVEEENVCKCEICEYWFHFDDCMGMNDKPDDGWSCIDCQANIQINRTTRSVSRR